eukprot:scaffold2259_cov18-Tisochrysis_lutea.AAC.1
MPQDAAEAAQGAGPLDKPLQGKASSYILTPGLFNRFARRNKQRCFTILHPMLVGPQFYKTESGIKVQRPTARWLCSLWTGSIGKLTKRKHDPKLVALVLALLPGLDAILASNTRCMAHAINHWLSHAHPAAAWLMDEQELTPGEGDTPKAGDKVLIDYVLRSQWQSAGGCASSWWRSYFLIVAAGGCQRPERAKVRDDAAKGGHMVHKLLRIEISSRKQQEARELAEQLKCADERLLAYQGSMKAGLRIGAAVGTAPGFHALLNSSLLSSVQLSVQPEHAGYPKIDTGGWGMK